MAQGRNSGAQHDVVRLPWQGSGHGAAELLGDVEQNVGHGPSVMQRMHGRRCHADNALRGARVGNVVEPGFQRSVIGQNQIGEDTGLIDEAAETYDVGNLRKGLADLGAGGRSEDRIRVMEQEHFWRARLIAKKGLGQRVQRRKAGLRGGRHSRGDGRLRREAEDGRLAPALDQCLQGVYGEGVEHSIGLSQRRAGNDSGSGFGRGNFTGQTGDRVGGDARLLGDAVGIVVRQARRPASDERSQRAVARRANEAFRRG